MKSEIFKGGVYGTNFFLPCLTRQVHRANIFPREGIKDFVRIHIPEGTGRRCFEEAGTTRTYQSRRYVLLQHDERTDTKWFSL